MTEEVLLSNIKETQDALSKYVKKNPLTEKLLKKPPFRYLHDIITAMIKETGFLDGLYTAEELDSNNIKDKESKIAFLDKLIVAVKNVTGKNVSARSVKIVAGLEVNDTLELLQLIGKAIDDKINTAQIVSEISKKENTKPQKSNKTNQNEEKKKGIPPSNNITKTVKRKSSNEVNDSNNVDEAKKINSSINGNNRIKETVTNLKGSQNKGEHSNERTQKNAATAEKQKNAMVKSKAQKKGNIRVTKFTAQSKSSSIKTPLIKDNKLDVNSSSKITQSVIKQEKKEGELATFKKDEESKAKNKKLEKQEIKKIVNKNTNDLENKKENQIQHEETNNFESKTKNDNDLKNFEKTERMSAKNKEAATIQRPGSARPGSRKIIQDDLQNRNSIESITTNEKSDINAEEIKNKSASINRPRTATRQPSARPGAPRIRDRGEVAVTEEPKVAKNSVNVFEERNQDQADDKDSIIVIKSEQTPGVEQEEIPPINDTEQGHLVHQILTTQKELSESVKFDLSQNKHLEIEWEAGKQKEREMVTKEVDKIRDSIQKLTSAANPLGKLFDFLQEDVDEMQRELMHWKNVNEKLHKQQLAELELKRTSLQPLEKQLQEIQNNIQDEYSQISNIKTTILTNDDKILKLLNDNKFFMN